VSKLLGDKKIRKELILVLLVCLGIPIILFAYVSGYPQYYITYIKCGKAPIIVEPSTNFAAANSRPQYYTKDDNLRYSPSYEKSYYCTKSEARNAGAEPGLFSNENLDKLGN
jgi:hypothetical protein